MYAQWDKFWSVFPLPLCGKIVISLKDYSDSLLNVFLVSALDLTTVGSPIKAIAKPIKVRFFCDSF